MRPSANTAFSALMLVIFCVFAAQSLYLTPAARMMPLIVSVPAIILSAVQLGVDLKVSRLQQTPRFRTATAEVTAVLWIAAFIAGVTLAGFLIGAPLITMLYLHYAAREKPVISIVAGLACLALLYGVFDRLFGVDLFEGLLFRHVL